MKDITPMLHVKDDDFELGRIHGFDQGWKAALLHVAQLFNDYFNLFDVRLKGDRDDYEELVEVLKDDKKEFIEELKKLAKGEV